MVYTKNADIKETMKQKEHLFLWKLAIENNCKCLDNENLYRLL